MKQAAKQMLDACERVDFNAALKPCDEGPDFAFAMPDGKVLNFSEMKNWGSEMFGTLASQKIITQKDGAVVESDPYCATYLYRKTGRD